MNLVLCLNGDPPNWAPLAVVDERDATERATELLNDQRQATMEALRGAIEGIYFETMRSARKDVEKALASNPGDSAMRQGVFKLARLYFYGFQEFDAAIFPITYGTDTGEVEQVGVVRAYSSPSHASIKMPCTPSTAACSVGRRKFLTSALLSLITSRGNAHA